MEFGAISTRNFLNRDKNQEGERQLKLLSAQRQKSGFKEFEIYFKLINEKQSEILTLNMEH